MDKIKLNDFFEYKFLSNLTDVNGDLYFNIANVSDDGKKYEVSIARLDGKSAKMITNNSGSGFITDGSAIYFKDARTEAEKEKKKSGAPYTAIYKLETTGGEAYKFLEFDYNLNPVKFTGDYLVMTESYDPAFDEYASASEDERKKMIDAKKENADYHEFDEIPFWSNGGGVTNKCRQRLAIYNLKSHELKIITDKSTDVNIADVKDGKVLIMSDSFTDKMPLTNDISIYDIESGVMNKISPFDDYAYSFAKFVGDKIIAGGSDMKEHGINENPVIITMTNDGEVLKKFKPDLSLWSSVGSDVRYGGGESIAAHNDELYFVSTEKYNAPLFKLDLDLNLTRLTEFEGSVDCFEFVGDKIYGILLKDQDLQEIYEIDKEVKAVSKINTAIDNKYVATPQKIEWSENGFDYTGFVLLPENFDKNKKYPAIMDIHGGPKTVYGPVFYHEMQYWVNLGYVVFFTNPRGGDGYGDAFSDIYGQYGDVDYKDLMHFFDLVMESYPNIDTNNVFVTGGSYGGFMTNWIVGHTDRFKAAATQRSISNWVSMWGTTDIGYYFASDQTRADVWASHDKMWDQSPLKYADKVKTPTLFIHSDEDYRCYHVEGLQFFTALKYHGVDAKFVWFKGENHELSRSGLPHHRVKRLSEITEWFNKYNN